MARHNAQSASSLTTALPCLPPQPCPHTPLQRHGLLHARRSLYEGGGAARRPAAASISVTGAQNTLPSFALPPSMVAFDVQRAGHKSCRGGRHAAAAQGDGPRGQASRREGLGLHDAIRGRDASGRAVRVPVRGRPGNLFKSRAWARKPARGQGAGGIFGPIGWGNCPDARAAPAVPSRAPQPQARPQRKRP